MNKNVVSFPQHLRASLACLLGAGLFALTGGSARATVVTYSDAAAFQAAAPGATAYSFPYPTTNDFVDRPYIDGPLGFSTFDHFTHLFLENDWVYGPELPYLSTIQPFGYAVTSAIEPQTPDSIFSLVLQL